LTKAVVAILVELSFAGGVGAIGVPVRTGLSSVNPLDEALMACPKTLNTIPAYVPGTIPVGCTSLHTFVKNCVHGIAVFAVDGSINGLLILGNPTSI